jgi:hypothetical protein
MVRYGGLSVLTAVFLGRNILPRALYGIPIVDWLGNTVTVICPSFRVLAVTMFTRTLDVIAFVALRQECLGHGVGSG